MDTSQTRSKERRQRLLDAALSVFSKKGYRDGAMDEIAGESGTSKGGVYFHFPSKQAIFLALLDRTAARLLDNVEEAIASENDPIAKADAALLAVLRTFARHRGLARLFMVEALGAGREFHERVLQIHGDFARVIKRQLDEAVAEGVIEPVDTDVASRAWFGALNEIVTTWVLSQKPGSLEESYRALRPILMRIVGVSDFSTKAQETR